MVRTSFSRPTARSGGVLSRRAVSLGAISGSLAMLAAAAVRAQPATADPLLVAGEIDIAVESSLAWRVVRDVAEVGRAADFEQRELGFAVNIDPFAALLVSDQATGSAYRLLPGEASFVRSGTWQRRQSMSEAAVGYLRIALVDAAMAANAGGDALLFSGPPQVVPRGRYTLSLDRYSLAMDDAMAAGAGLARALVLVEQGSIEFQGGDADPGETLETVVGSDTVYGIRTIRARSRMVATRDATSLLVGTLT